MRSVTFGAAVAVEPQSVTTTDKTPSRVVFEPVRFTSSWREESLARICELRILSGALLSGTKLPAGDVALLKGARTELDHAEQAARRRRSATGALTGAAVQRVHAHLDAAEVLVLRGASLEYVRGQTPALVGYVRRHLPPGDPRCQAAERLLAAEETGSRRRARPAGLAQADRERLASAVQGAMAEARNEQMRLRSFRNLLFNSAVGLLALAIGVCVFGAVAPGRLPVCFEPVRPAATAGTSTATRQLVCPTRESPMPTGTGAGTVVEATARRTDVPLIELLGLIAAAVAASTALRKVRGTSTPYSLPAALAFLKLPLGALTALLGLILMRADFVPGLSALDDSAQILGWAIVFGYAQQAFTQVVDRKAQNLLEDVGTADQKAAEPEAARPAGRTAAP